MSPQLPPARAAGRRRPAGRRPLREQLAHAARIVEMMMGLPAGRPEDFRPASFEALRIGANASLSCGRLRALLRAHRNASPDVELTLAALTGEEVLRRVRSGQLDLGLVCHDAPSPALDVQALWREPLFVVLPSDHPLARENAVDPAQLAGLTLLTSDQDLGGADRLLYAAVAAAPPLPTLPVEADRETLFNMVALGFGVAFTSASALGAYYPGVVYRPILKCDKAVGYAAVWRKGSQDVALHAFLRRARAQVPVSETAR